MAEWWDKYPLAGGATAPASGPAPTPATAPSPSAASGTWMDKYPVIGGAKPSETAQAASPAPPQRSLTENIGRQVGLTVRHGAEGLAKLAEVGTEPIRQMVVNPLARAVGAKEVQPLSQGVSQMADSAGLPKPENALERVVGDATAALAGTGGIVKAGQALSKSAMPLVQGAGKALAADPKLQAVSSAIGAAASGATREGGGSEGAQLAAGLLGALAPVALSPTRVAASGGRQTRTAAQNANELGYVIPPVELSPNSVVEGLSGFSGKAKTAQVASARNQSTSNNLARKALGIGPEVDLNVDTLEGLRKQAASAYAPVARAGTVVPTTEFTKALDDAIAPFVSQRASFPGMKVPEVVNDIAALRSPQFDSGDALAAIRTMREGADKAYRAGEAQSGKAYRQAASALENALETHLQGMGQPGADILKGFRDARQQIAKTWTVQNALNPSTGNINAIKLASDLAKNKPLTADLRSVGEFAQAFPKAAQALKEAPNATSPLDWVPAVLTAVGTGNPLPLAAVGARPAARSFLLSSGAQQAAIANAGTSVQRVPQGAGGIALSAAAGANNAEPAPEATFRNRIQAGYAARQSGGVVVPVDGGFVVRPR